MQGKITTITPQGDMETTLIERPEYHIIHDAVVGLIETIPLWDFFQGARCVAFCNEEGKLEGQEFNRTATRLWNECLANHHGIHPAKNSDHLVGTVAILQGDAEFMESI